MNSIIAALQKIAAQGEFYAKSTLATNHLALDVKEVGPLKFPLTKRSVKALIKVAQPAKFGWRNETVLDKKVRHAWEIPKKSLKFNTASWNKALLATLSELKAALGLSDQSQLQAQLHNLLIYEPSQFFDYHQDTEKCAGMVASLVIVLPSAHRGGALVIENQGVKKQFQSSRFPLDQLTCLAFYADCPHAVKKVTEGYRVAITYNLILNQLDTKITVPDKRQGYDAVSAALQDYFSNQVELKKCVYLLDHDYSQKGLSWQLLKNADGLRAEALKAAADALDLDIYLSLADVQETWDCEEEYSGYYNRRQRHYWREDEDDEGTATWTLNELIDSSITLQHWLDRDNVPLDYVECSVSTSQVMWTKATNDFKPFDSEHEGYMGNYGNTVDHWYHRAAIVLWRKKDHYPMRFKSDPDKVLTELLSLTKKKSGLIKAQKIVQTLLPYWQESFKNRISEPQGVFTKLCQPL